MPQPLVFISYSRRDEAEKNELLSHLRVLQQAGLVDVWSDDRIRPGMDWQWEIDQAMAQAQIAILLITTNYLASDFMNQQIRTLLERRNREGLIVFPVIARACAWDKVDWLRRMEVRPKGGQPVWRDQGNPVDEGLAAIAGEVADIVAIIQKQQHLQSLIAQKMYRLDALKNYIAYEGDNVSPNIVLEMATIRNQIDEFQGQIDELQTRIDAASTTLPAPRPALSAQLGCWPVWVWAAFGTFIIFVVGFLFLIGGVGVVGAYLSSFRSTTTPSPTNTRIPTLPPLAVAPSLTPSPTAQPPPTVTPTPLPPTPTPVPPTPTPYFVEIVIDASERMSEEFETGFTKMESAWQSARTIARTKVQKGQFVSIRLFGGGDSSGDGSCFTSDSLFDFTGDDQQLVGHLNQLPAPGGKAAAVTALLDASGRLQAIDNIGREIILLTGGDDGCGSTLSDFYKSDNQSLWTQTFVVLFNDEDFGPFIDLEIEGANIEYNLVKNRAEAETVAVAIANQPPPATPTPTPTMIIIAAATATNPPTATPRPGSTPVPPATPIAINPTVTVASVPGQTPTSTPSPTPTPTPTKTTAPTFTPTKTFTPPPTVTLTPTPTKTATPTPTVTPTPTKTVTPTPIPTPTPPPVDTTALPPQNDVYKQGCSLINQTTGFNTIESGGGDISANLISQGQTGQGLKLDFSVANTPSNYAGWEVLLGDSNSGIDLSSFDNLVFSIRGDDGGETPNIWLMMPIINEEFERYFLRLELGTSWQQAVIPLSHFTTGTAEGEQVDLDQIHRIQVIFEWYSEPTSGTIYLDDLCVQ